jgi:thioredoxin 1
MKLLAVTNKTFEAEVLKSEIPVLVDFWADWCGPCKTIAPIIEALAERYEGKLKVVKVDVGKEVALGKRYEIRSIPTLLLFKKGKVVGQIVGSVPKAKIESAIKGALE